MADKLEVIKKIIEAKPSEQLAISAYISGLQDGMQIQKPEKKCAAYRPCRRLSSSCWWRRCLAYSSYMKKCKREVLRNERFFNGCGNRRRLGGGLLL